METTLTCQVCLLPLNQCQQNDLKLIKPVDNRFAVSFPTKQYVDLRKWRAFYYMQGAYDTINNRYYYVENVFGYHDTTYGWVNIPTCVWEGNYEMLTRMIADLNWKTICKIPIAYDYITILKQLAADVVSSYVSSLPPPPKLMPTKRLKTN